jgi:hypothetical protein
MGGFSLRCNVIHGHAAEVNCRPAGQQGWQEGFFPSFYREQSRHNIFTHH